MPVLRQWGTDDLEHNCDHTGGTTRSSPTRARACYWGTTPPRAAATRAGQPARWHLRQRLRQRPLAAHSRSQPAALPPYVAPRGQGQASHNNGPASSVFTREPSATLPTSPGDVPALWYGAALAGAHRLSHQDLAFPTPPASRRRDARADRRLLLSFATSHIYLQSSISTTPTYHDRARRPQTAVFTYLDSDSSEPHLRRRDMPASLANRLITTPCRTPIPPTAAATVRRGTGPGAVLSPPSPPLLRGPECLLRGGVANPWARSYRVLF